jgi:hypothetical protein
MFDPWYKAQVTQHPVTPRLPNRVSGVQNSASCGNPLMLGMASWYLACRMSCARRVLMGFGFKLGPGEKPPAQSMQHLGQSYLNGC